MTTGMIFTGPLAPAVGLLAPAIGPLDPAVMEPGGTAVMGLAVTTLSLLPAGKPEGLLPPPPPQAVMKIDNNATTAVNGLRVF